jgi:anti-sigma factor ChrR (cupin superfamily)
MFEDLLTHPTPEELRALSLGQLAEAELDRVCAHLDACPECCRRIDRLAAAGTGQRRKWEERTPAMAAGLTDHRWTMREWLSRPIPLPPWVPPKRRVRPPKRSQAAMA